MPGCSSLCTPPAGSCARPGQPQPQPSAKPCSPLCIHAGHRLDLAPALLRRGALAGHKRQQLAGQRVVPPDHPAGPEQGEGSGKRAWSRGGSGREQHTLPGSCALQR